MALSQVKIKNSDVIELRADKVALGTYKAVAKKWGVCPTTVYMHLHPEVRKPYAEVATAHKKKHLIKINKRNSKSTLKWRQKHPERQLLTQAKHRAKRKGLDFNLEESDIIIPTLCPILEVPLQAHIGQPVLGHPHDNSPSVDRTDPRLGYVKGNIEVVSYLANRIKGNVTDPAVFEAIAKYLRKQETKNGQ